MIPNNANTYLPGVIQIASTLLITAISQSFPAIISISVDPITAANTYIGGQLVKLNIPFGYGMQQANGLTVLILDVSGSNLIVDLDTRNFDPFSVPLTGEMPASLSPSGARNLALDNTTNQEPFQSLNNVGN